MTLKRMHWIGIIAGGFILIGSAILFVFTKDFNMFLFLLGLSVAAIILPFVVGVSLEGKREEEMSSMFLEFSRNLAESVATGTPISKSIVNMSKKNYGPLTPHVQKLANQIQLGIPVNEAMKIFAREIGNNVISRAVALMSEAERAGGELGYILESTASSIAEVEKLKKERKSAVFNLIVQGYIIFVIFIGIMLVMEFKIIPLTSGLTGFDTTGSGSLTGLGGSSTGGGTSSFSAEELARPFLLLLLTQGFFAGLVIGKLSEGSVKAGVKHSFVMVILAFLVSTGARVLFS